MKNFKIAITGGTGLVGSHLAEYLAKKGHYIRALVRNYRNVEPFKTNWSNLGIEVKQVDVLDASGLEEAFAGVDIVIHAAGIVDPYAPADDIFAVNVLGSKLVLETAASIGVKQLIFLSSLSVITGNNDQYNTPENAPLRLCGEPYADSKVQAEQIISNNTYKDKIAVTIIRPGFIYGPRERAWLPQLIKAIAGGRAVLVDQGKKETNVIYVENLNQAIESTLLNEKAYNQIYNLTDGESITKKQLFDAISDELDLPRVTKNVPGWLVKPIFSVISSAAANMPPEKRKKLSRFSKAAYRLIGINQGFSIAKAEKELNYRNRIPFSEGIKSTLYHFQQEKPPSSKPIQRMKVGGTKS